MTTSKTDDDDDGHADDNDDDDEGHADDNDDDNDDSNETDIILMPMMMVLTVTA